MVLYSILLLIFLYLSTQYLLPPAPARGCADRKPRGLRSAKKALPAPSRSRNPASSVLASSRALPINASPTVNQHLASCRTQYSPGRRVKF
ncbi:hypothetical protein F4780DRAFT_746445 [Xylariomycetidae sp. FL0641]|nr:hypothetical protein F4780DRAFT_746445 [Xylariomycetidae sp. FL0641]